MKDLQEYNRLIQNSRVYECARETPLGYAAALSTRLKKNVYLKREDTHPVFSFKLRGAYNLIASLPPSRLKAGILAVSAGNHAQGVALSAQKLGLKAVIVMPRTTPDTKVRSVRSYRGVSLILHGDTFDEARVYSRRLIKEKGYVYIPPFDDKLVIAGQGTIGAEILRQRRRDLDAIFVPVGGGGLIAGIGAYIKYVRPEVKVIGVEPEDAAGMTEALRRKKRITLPHVGIFADGVAVNRVGAEPYRLARKCVDDMVTVTTDEICAGIKDVFEDTRVLAEPAGALAVAGMRKFCGECPAAAGLQNLVAILSGANTNFDRLRHIAERTEIGEQREALFGVTIPEKRGSFRAFCRLLRKYEITEFNYRYADPHRANIFVGVRIASKEDIGHIADTLNKHHFPNVDMTDNEVAKLHIRYMVGGAPPFPREEEALFRFEFPERPGALLRFLDTLSPKWNVSLFHYRNHGAAYGRILAGMQVPRAERGTLMRYLREINYTFYPETDNDAYHLFLSRSTQKSSQKPSPKSS